MPSPEESSVPSALDEVCARALALPCSPALLPRLAGLLENADADIDDLAALIRVDPVLAAATVRMANSVYFAGGEPVASVAEAVMRLGLRELYRLAALSLAARWMATDAEGYRWEPGDFCRAAVVRAVAAEALALRGGAVDPALAYTCGLVHEIGKLAVAFCCPQRFAEIRAWRAARGGTWLEAEQAVLGFTHAAVSARLLAEWRFPAACVAAAAHNPPGPGVPAEHRALIAHIHAACFIAASLGPGQGEDAFLWAIDGRLMAEAGLDEQALVAVMPAVLERSSRLLGEKLQTGRVVF